ncbi:hypothetical protein ACFBBH_004578, partial [Escherichia coli]
MIPVESDNHRARQLQAVLLPLARQNGKVKNETGNYVSHPGVSPDSGKFRIPAQKREKHVHDHACYMHKYAIHIYLPSAYFSQQQIPLSSPPGT